MSQEKKKIWKKDSFEDAIGKACEGLFYVSETDAAILPFSGGKADDGTRKSISKALSPEKNTTVVEQPVDEFFSRLTKPHDWHTEVETEKVKRFLKLQKLLKDNLKGITVLRIGRIRIDIYVVGIDGSGDLAGIKTKAVET